MGFFFRNGFHGSVFYSAFWLRNHLYISQKRGRGFILGLFFFPETLQEDYCFCFSYSRFSLQPILAFMEPQLDWLRDFDGVNSQPMSILPVPFCRTTARTQLDHFVGVKGQCFEARRNDATLKSSGQGHIYKFLYPL